MNVYRYGAANPVCTACQLDRCFECQGTDLEPCECCCPDLWQPDDRRGGLTS